jgi:hypothetical protein
MWVGERRQRNHSSRGPETKGDCLRLRRSQVLPGGSGSSATLGCERQGDENQGCGGESFHVVLAAVGRAIACRHGRHDAWDLLPRPAVGRGILPHRGAVPLRYELAHFSCQGRREKPSTDAVVRANRHGMRPRPQGSESAGTVGIRWSRRMAQRAPILGITLGINCRMRGGLRSTIWTVSTT